MVKVRPEQTGNPEIKKEKIRELVLHNDDFNTFEHVIISLIEICEHDALQAEQCALITHHKGRCGVKNGEYEVLKPLKDALIERKLSVTIE
ncbi:MAG TPA: Clp protease ClpS [Bacteroidales bacterium]|nr:Clp protease ClpS [Bacteroidales bacterium]